MIYRSPLLGPLYRPRGVAVILGVRLAAALALPFARNTALVAVLLLVLIATAWLFKLRNWLGEDGADQMGQIVVTGSFLTAVGIELDDSPLCLAGTLLIAGQLTISYVLGGLAKLVSAEWRSGRAVVGVMGTRGYGHAFAARIASSSALFAIAFCWLVIIVETIFPLFLFAPPHILWYALAAFAAFHVATAYFMGLNTFVWAFVAAYPAVILLNELMAVAIHRP
jgi:hypothetical protein